MYEPTSTTVSLVRTTMLLSAQWSPSWDGMLKLTRMAWPVSLVLTTMLLSAQWLPSWDGMLKSRKLIRMALPARTVTFHSHCRGEYLDIQISALLSFRMSMTPLGPLREPPHSGNTSTVTWYGFQRMLSSFWQYQHSYLVRVSNNAEHIQIKVFS